MKKRKTISEDTIKKLKSLSKTGSGGSINLAEEEKKEICKIWESSEFSKTVSLGLSTDEVLSKEEAKKKGNAYPIVRTKWAISFEYILEELCRPQDPERAIKMFKEEILSATQDKELRINMFMNCEMIETYLKLGHFENAIGIAYRLGQACMMEKLREHVRRPLGRKTSALDPIYWGEKLDNYYNECDKQNKSAKTYAYEHVRNDWRKEIPNLSSNPVPSDVTLKKYWDAYLKQK